MQMRTKRWLAAALAFLLLGSVAFTACNMGAKNEKQSQEQSGQNQPVTFKPLDTTSKKVVAEYSGGKITEGDLNRYINLVSFFRQDVAFIMANAAQNPKLKEDFAKQYAVRLYAADQVKDDPKYRQEAEKMISDMDNEFKKSGNKDPKVPKSLDEAIKGKGFTKQDLLNFLTLNQRLNAYYDEQMKGKEYVQVKVQHILIGMGDGSNGLPKRSDAEAKKRAEEVKQKLAAGEDFAKLAKQYSDDTGSKDNGGIIEGPSDQFVPAFKQASETLPLNKISDPVKTEYGYHIMKVLERKNLPLDKAPDEVKSAKEQQLYDEIVSQKLQFRYLNA
jgi:foldase protein PrsA